MTVVYSIEKISRKKIYVIIVTIVTRKAISGSREKHSKLQSMPLKSRYRRNLLIKAKILLIGM